jgi:hypothetical protein
LQLPPRPVCLAGRDELLAGLDVRLAPGDDSGPQIVALFGLGGAGKTSVAVEYAHRHLNEVGVAWQFTAEDPAVLAAGFGELAAQLGARDVLDSRDPVLTVHGVLAEYRAGWLLIFDNAPDRACVEAFLPPAGRGRVLITSRNQVWPPGQGVEVPVLHVQVAAEFLVNRTRDPDRQAARKLAADLGGLPLALEQAGAYIQATGESLAGYLGSFQHKQADLLARGEPTGYDKTVATTWALPFERLQQDEPGAVGLLRLLAYCAPAPIPLRLLLQPRPGLGDQLGEEVAPVLLPLLDPLAADDAIAALHRYSLVTQVEHGMVSVHRLVQVVTADRMPADVARAWRQAADAVIGAAIPDDTALPENWPACAALLPHAQKALAEDSHGMARIANYLGSSGSYAAARDLQRRVLAARERVLGPEHPDTLTTRNDLAYWTGQAGEAAAARDQLAELVPVRERVSGPEHPHTLATRANLAYWTGQAGEAAAACDQLAELVPVRERVSGPEHPSTLVNRVNLAQWTGNAGDAPAARDQLMALLPVIERVFGPEHPQTLTTQHELARLTGEAGDPAAARDQFAELLPVIERAYGPEHPQTLATHGNLAYWIGEAGDPAAARDQFAEQLPIISRVLGPEHPRTLANRRNLAQWTGEAGDPAAARDQLARLLPVLERVFGPQHRDTLAVQTSLARWTREAERDPGPDVD